MELASGENVSVLGFKYGRTEEEIKIAEERGDKKTKSMIDHNADKMQ